MDYMTYDQTHFLHLEHNLVDFTAFIRILASISNRNSSRDIRCVSTPILAPGIDKEHLR